MSQDFINEADDNAIIPIYGGAESLNVASGYRNNFI